MNYQKQVTRLFIPSRYVSASNRLISLPQPASSNIKPAATNSLLIGIVRWQQLQHCVQRPQPSHLITRCRSSLRHWWRQMNDLYRDDPSRYRRRYNINMQSMFRKNHTYDV